MPCKNCKCRECVIERNPSVEVSIAQSFEGWVVMALGRPVATHRDFPEATCKWLWENGQIDRFTDKRRIPHIVWFKVSIEDFMRHFPHVLIGY